MCGKEVLDTSVYQSKNSLRNTRVVLRGLYTKRKEL